MTSKFPIALLGVCLGCSPSQTTLSKTAEPVRPPSPPVSREAHSVSDTAVSEQRVRIQISTFPSASALIPPPPPPGASAAPTATPPRLAFVTPDGFTRTVTKHERFPEVQSAFVTNEDLIADFTVTLAPKSYFAAEHPICSISPKPTNQLEVRLEVETEGPPGQLCAAEWEGEGTPGASPTGFSGAYYAGSASGFSEYQIEIIGEWFGANTRAVRPLFDAFVKSVRAE